MTRPPDPTLNPAIRELRPLARRLGLWLPSSRRPKTGISTCKGTARKPSRLQARQARVLDYAPAKDDGLGSIQPGSASRSEASGASNT